MAYRNTKITQHALKVSVFKQSSSWTDTIQKRHREREGERQREERKKKRSACARLKELSSREREREVGDGGGGRGGHFQLPHVATRFPTANAFCHPVIFCHHVPKRSLAARFVTPSPKYHYNLSSLFPRGVCVCVCVCCADSVPYSHLLAEEPISTAAPKTSRGWGELTRLKINNCFVDAYLLPLSCVCVCGREREREREREHLLHPILNNWQKIVLKEKWCQGSWQGFGGDTPWSCWTYRNLEPFWSFSPQLSL